MHNSELVTLRVPCLGLSFCFCLAFGLGLGPLCLKPQKPHCYGCLWCCLMDFLRFLNSRIVMVVQLHLLDLGTVASSRCLSFSHLSRLCFLLNSNIPCVEIRGIGMKSGWHGRSPTFWALQNWQTLSQTTGDCVLCICLFSRLWLGDIQFGRLLPCSACWVLVIVSNPNIALPTLAYTSHTS